MPLPSYLLRLQGRDGASIAVSPHGGHLCSWRGTDGSERLFMSERTRWDQRSALRGGVPIIFPQFADFGVLPKHGFARLLPWTVRSSHCDIDGIGVMRLTLGDSAATAALAGQFLLELTLRFCDQSLQIGLQIHNTGDSTFGFSAALHTYLRTEVAHSAVSGLQSRSYRDSADGGRMMAGAAGQLIIDGEIDRIYCDLPTPLMLVAPQRRVEVSQRGFTDVVVWNPWREKAAALTDLAEHEYMQFVCIEAALVAHPATLQPGQCWTGMQQLQVLAPA